MPANWLAMALAAQSLARKQNERTIRIVQPKVELTSFRR